jgi:hypothetical protein
MAIPGNSTFSTEVLNFDGVVVVVGDYYYNDKTRSIEKRSNKRKRGESTNTQSSIGRVIEWKAGPDPEDNAIQETSTLHAFQEKMHRLFLKLPQHYAMQKLKF